MRVKKRLNIMIYPNEEQKDLIKKTIGSCRFVYNQILVEMIDAKDKTGHYTTKKQRSARLVSLKHEFSWLKDVDSAALQQAVKDLGQAVDNHFKSPDHFGFPKFKVKHFSTQSYRTPYNNGRTNIINENHIKIPKVGIVSSKKISLPKDYKLLSVTIIHKKSGKYIASICYESVVNDLPKTNKHAGFDLGLIDLLISSDGLKIPPPKFGRKMEKKLAKAKRKLSKMRTKLEKANVDLSEAKNYQKQKRLVAKIYEHIANQRKDFNHKLSKELVENYDILVFEDLNINEMMKNHKLAYAIQDISWSQLLRFIEYKALWYGKEFKQVPMFYASSKICSTCGSYHKDIVKDLSVREWECPDCGSRHDRDINAAKNIRQNGIQTFKFVI